MQKWKPSSSLGITSLSLGFLGLYVLGTLYPQVLWGIHTLAFLPKGLSLFFLCISLLLVLLPFLAAKYAGKLYAFFSFDLRQNIWAQIFISLGMGILFYSFPIAQSSYGDARFLSPQIDILIPEWYPELFSRLFTLDLFDDTKTGERTFFNLINLFTYITAAKGLEVWRAIGICLGVTYVFLWLRLVSVCIHNTACWWVMVIIGLSAPCMQMFYGHIEVYPLVMPSLLGFQLAMVLFFKTQKQLYLFILPILFLLNLKFHITTYFLLPSLLLVYVYVFFPANKWLFNWKKLSIYVLLPLILVGTFVYFFITKSARATRLYTKENLYDAVFLPIDALEGPPLDRYNLFSLNHIMDYLNMPFIWSAAALFLLVAIGLKCRKQIDWNQPALLLTGLSLIIYGGSFFVLNPLLSMPMDWDLFSLPAPIFLSFILLLVSQIQDRPLLSALIPGCLALSLLGTSFFITNANPDFLSKRLEYIGKHSFKTYWLGSSTPINEALSLENSLEEVERRRTAILKELAPYVIYGNDLQYSELLAQMGIFYFKQKDYRHALAYFERALQVDPLLKYTPYYLVISHFYLKDYKATLSYLKKLIQHAYPNQERAYRIAIHSCIEAEAYENARNYCRGFLNKWPNDPFIEKVLHTLETAEDPAVSRFLFRQE